MPFWLKGLQVGIDVGETSPAGLGRGKHALEGWLDQVRLGINALLVKRRDVGWGWMRGKHVQQC